MKLELPLLPALPLHTLDSKLEMHFYWEVLALISFKQRNLGLHSPHNLLNSTLIPSHLRSNNRNRRQASSF